jgi:glutathione synthase/RimK-type ligase-like ATP-grasp enzyme
LSQPPRLAAVHVALVSSVDALPLDEDMPPLVDALRRAGAKVSTPCWDDAAVEWSNFDAAVLRSTWNYVDHIEAFRAWTQRCAQHTRLMNPPAVIAWNTDKHYLAHLHRAGVPVVPSRFVEPGADPDSALRAFLDGAAGALSAGRAVAFDQFVIKPSIGAGSRDTARYLRDDFGRALSHLERLVGQERRSALLQPYLTSVDTAGETALIYFGGTASHAIRKGPLLRLDSGLVAGLFAPEDIRAREPGADERALAAAAYAAIPFDAPLYARIDMIRDDEDRPVILELEMTEPSVFFAHAPGSADRFAQAVLAHLGDR